MSERYLGLAKPLQKLNFCKIPGKPFGVYGNIHLNMAGNQKETEIELAWLVKFLPSDFKSHHFTVIRQAYLETKDPKIKDIRVRDNDGVFTRTIKYFAKDSAETGYCYEETQTIPHEEFERTFLSCQKKIKKTRYYYPLPQNLVAEVDIYDLNLKGLIVVEVEFPNIEAYKNFQIPEWFGKEVTDSLGIYPPHIANLTPKEVNKINAEYSQKPHDFH